MLTLMAVLAVVGLFVVLGMYAASQKRRLPKSETQARAHGVPRVDEFPDPGEPSPHRADGTAVPGSRDARRAQGKP